MSKSLFLDTGYIIALEAVDDQHHNDAIRHWNTLKKSIPLLVTTSYIFDEIVTFFNSRSRHAKAVEIGNRLLNSPSVQFIHVDESLFFNAWAYFRQIVFLDRLHIFYGNETAWNSGFAFF